MDEYGRIARLYDPFISPALRPLHREILSLLAARGCASVVDLCCGTGQLAAMAARSGMVAAGVDLSRSMIVRAAAKSSAHFILGDATVLPFPDDSRDGAAICFALHEKPPLTGRAILSEARRIVRPGGLLVVADYRLASGGWLSGRMIAAIERLAGRKHHAHFRRYLDGGGTEGFLHAAKLPGRCEKTFFNGWAGVYSVPIP